MNPEENKIFLPLERAKILILRNVLIFLGINKSQNCKPRRDLKDNLVQLHSADREGDFPKVAWLIRAGLRLQLF